MRPNRVLVIVGGLILLLGAQLPWVSFPVLFGFQGAVYDSLEIGWEGSGLITGSIGLILLLINIFWQGKTRKTASILGAILAGLAVLHVSGSFYRIIEINPAEGVLEAADVGLYMTLLGALLALAGSLWRPSENQKKQDSSFPRIALVCGFTIAFLLSGCTSKAAPELTPMTPHPLSADAQPMVIDTDMAADDWLAILYLLGRSDVNVRAITVTGAGEAHCPSGVKNALNLAALAGRPDIPIACGRETPLAGDHTFPTACRNR